MERATTLDAYPEYLFASIYGTTILRSGQAKPGGNASFHSGGVWLCGVRC